MENKTSYTDAIELLNRQGFVVLCPEDFKATEELRKQNEVLTNLITEQISVTSKSIEGIEELRKSNSIMNKEIKLFMLEIERLKESNKELVEALDHLTSNNGLLKCVYDGGEKSLLYESYTNARMLITKSKP